MGHNCNFTSVMQKVPKSIGSFRVYSSLKQTNKQTILKKNKNGAKHRLMPNNRKLKTNSRMPCLQGTLNQLVR